MLAGFISQSPLPPRELTYSLTRMADSLVVHQKAHRIVFAPHIAGAAFAPDWRTTPPVCQTQAGHIAYLDGEFFNSAALSQPATSDPEFLVQAITGESELLNRIDGLFSGVVFDIQKNELHIITDRYGLRPLYWTRQGNRIAWASQTKAFLALPGFLPVIDPISRDMFFATGQLPPDRTWLEGVAPVPAATQMTFCISDGSLTQQRYWFWDEIAPLTRHHTQRELAHELGVTLSHCRRTENHRTNWSRPQRRSRFACDSRRHAPYTQNFHVRASRQRGCSHCSPGCIRKKRTTHHSPHPQSKLALAENLRRVVCRWRTRPAPHARH